jgi:hypothetical protein
MAYGAVHWVHSFLAINAPVEARVMVVEGWIPMSALTFAADQYRKQGYDMICTVGCLKPGESSEGIGNDAIIVADQFLEMGIPKEQVHAVPSGFPERDRTFTSARVLKAWFDESIGVPSSLNVVTMGVHSRRSRMLFETAFAGKADVGVISCPELDYDSSRWWNSSEGVKEVVTEVIAYCYARFFLLFRSDAGK